jgi:hypothetical protein
MLNSYQQTSKWLEQEFFQPIQVKKDDVYKQVKTCFSNVWTKHKSEMAVYGTESCIEQFFEARWNTLKEPLNKMEEAFKKFDL